MLIKVKIFLVLLSGLVLVPYFLTAEPITYVNTNAYKLKEKTKDVKISIPEIITQTNNTYCSCIKTARELGVDIPYSTNAEDLVPNSVPQIGCLVLMTYPKSSHVATILNFLNEGIQILEGNKTPCKESVRIIPYNYKYLKGFWCSTANKL